MIHSMTAFARQEASGDWGTINCEIRSVNHRYLEMTFRLPDVLGALEPLLRDAVRKAVHRGKLECTLRYRPNNTESGALQVNIQKVEQLMEICRQVAQQVQHSAPMAVLDILAWPGVVQTTELDMEKIEPFVMAAFSQTVKDLMNMRQREGTELINILNTRLMDITMVIQRVRARLPQLIQIQREKIVARFNDLKMDLDGTRLEQEMVLFVHRSDVTEELDRLEVHIHEVQRVLVESGAQGRRLDFLMQELNREANTLGSKSSDSAVTAAAVELKVLIEQMREQIQNIE